MANHWHYQVMKHKGEEGDWYGIHEYYPFSEGKAGWTKETISLDKAETVSELRTMIWRILDDFDKHGVKDYE